MNEFNDFWDILPNKDENVWKELTEFLSDSIQSALADKEQHDVESESSTLSERTIQFLRRNLNDHPFPTFLLVNLLKNLAKHELLFDDLEFYGLSNALENITETKEFDKFYCMLANIHVKGDNCEKLCYEILKDVSAKVNNGVLSEMAVYLALLSRDDKLLEHYLSHDKNVSITENPSKYVFFQALYYNRNCLYDIITNSDKERYTDVNLLRYHNAIRLIDIVNRKQGKQFIIEELFTLTDPLLKSIDLTPTNDLLKVYTLEIMREMELLKFIKQDKPKLKSVSSSEFSRQKRIVYQIAQYLDLSYEMYTKIEPLFIQNDEMIDQILNIYNPNNIAARMNDFVSFCMITCVKLMIDLIKSDHTQNEYEKMVQQTFIHIQEIINKIEPLQERLTLVEIFYTLLFVTSKDIHISSSSLRSNIAKDSDFLCCEQLVEATLKYLQTYLLKIKGNSTFMDEPEATKLRVDSLFSSIKDAIYRFKLVTNAPKKSESFLETQFVDPKKLVFLHIPQQRDLERDARPCTADNEPEETALDLEKLYKLQRDDPKQIINRMLSPPESLAVLYASRGDTEELEDIIRTYTLENTTIGSYASYKANFTKAKNELCESIQKVNSESIYDDDEYIKIFEATKVGVFATTNPIHQTMEEKFIIQKYKRFYKHLLLYEDEGLKCINQVDMMASLPCSLTQNRYLHNELVQEYLKPQKERYGELDPSVYNHQGYIAFLENLIEGLENYKQAFQKELTIQEFLTTEYVPLDKEKINHHVAKLQFHQRMSGFDSSSFTSAADLEDKSGVMPLFSVNYFKRAINYTKTIESLLSYSQDEYDLSPNALLNLDLDKVIADIVMVEKVPPHEIKDIVLSLGKNLMHVLINAELFPKIMQYPLRVEEEKELLKHLRQCLEQPETEAKTFDVDSLMLKKSDNSYLLPHIDRNNPFVTQIIREAHKEQNTQSPEYSLAPLARLSQTTPIQTLSKLFDGNELLTALNYDNIDIRLLYSYLVKTTDYKTAILIIDSIKGIQYKRHQNEFDKIRDIFLKNLIDSSADENDFWFLCRITDFHKKSYYVNQHIYKIKDHTLVKRLLKDLLVETPDKCLHPNFKQQLTKWVFEVEVYEEIGKFITNVNWLDVRTKSYDEPENILNEILLRIINTLEILPKWIQLHPLNTIKSKEQLKRLFQIITIHICHQDVKEVNQKVFDAIETLDPDEVFEIYNELLMGTKRLSIVQYLIEYVVKSEKATELHQKIYISVKIFGCLPEQEYTELWHLIKAPQLIIEQFLMNTRIEKLSEIIKAITPILHNKKCKLCQYKIIGSNEISTSSGSNPSQLVKGSSSESTDYIMINYDVNHNRSYLTVDCINFLLKSYASKALLFNVDQSKTLAGLFNKYSKRSKQSIDSNEVFEMPEKVPKKSDWVPDDAASVCMCCKLATFTILTRKHHCRRCGRVICRVCSSKRIKIPEIYSTLPVRVCLDCTRCMTFDKNKTTFTMDEQWVFSGNNEHDAVVRENFSYEFAPNVQLCVSMCELNLSHEDCASFFIEQAAKLECLFQPLAPRCPNPEIDHELVATMMSCLVLRAKLHGANDSECNHLLEHAELAKSLVDLRCEELIEPIDQKGGPVKMLDSLIKAEQWNLAIGLATKHRFNVQAIQAASAMMCLRAGRFKAAKEKFDLCLTPIDGAKQLLDKFTAFINSDSPLNREIQKEWPVLSRPSQSPSKVQEIIKTLKAAPQGVTNNYIKQQNNSSNKSEPPKEVAVNIQSRIANLKNISANNFTDVVQERQLYRNSIGVKGTSKIFLFREEKINSVFFNEGLRYLLLFGSHADILEFLVSHFQIVAAIRYLFIQNLKTVDFIEHIFFPCMKKKVESIIFDYFFETDATLMLWANYIKDLIVRLERNRFWPCLSNVFVSIKDFHKAALLHMRLYKIGCKNYADLRRSRCYLKKAVKYIQDELAITNWEVVGTLNMTERSVTTKCGSATLNNLLKLISEEEQIVKFLYHQEVRGINVVASLDQITIDPVLPTMFDDKPSKICLAILVFIHGETLESGFHLIKNLPSDYQLGFEKIIVGVAKYLAANDRANQVEPFFILIRANYQHIENLEMIISDAAEQAVMKCYDRYGKDHYVTELIHIIDIGINDVTRQVNNYLYIDQLSRAFMLASRRNNIEALRLIQVRAIEQNHRQMKRLCKIKLGILLGEEEKKE